MPLCVQAGSHTLELLPTREPARFHGVCSCGATFGPFRTAGMVQSAHAEHVDAVEQDDPS